MGSGDAEADAVAAELRHVRYELDRLVEARLLGQLSLAAEVRYERLARREEYLLGGPQSYEAAGAA